MTSPAVVVERTAEHLKSIFAGDSSGHDWWHTDRVRRIAIQIAREEQADCYIVELAALLHDVADWKFHGGDDSAGPRAAREWLTNLGVEAHTVEAVCEIISRVSFKGAGVATEMPTLEGKCVQDSDRLDAIGAIGIARAFSYGGHFGRPMYDPNVPPTMHASFEAYKSGGGPSINHFYEKLLLLKDRMQTKTGRRIAEQRHEFMELYLKQFFDEWNFGEPTRAHPT